MGEQKQKKCRPVSLLNMFSKIYEKYIHNNLTEYDDLIEFIYAYWRRYS